MQGLKNQTVIVTGGGGGIGSATCRRFAAEGAKVAVFDMNPAAAEEVAAGICAAAGGQAAAFQCDITDRAQVDASRGAATGLNFSPVGVLVNNAGWDVSASSRPCRPSGDRLIAINSTGALHYAARRSRHVRAQVGPHRQRGF